MTEEDTFKVNNFCKKFKPRGKYMCQDNLDVSKIKCGTDINPQDILKEIKEYQKEGSLMQKFNQLRSLADPQYAQTA